jgi:hypothetical protein
MIIYCRQPNCLAVHRHARLELVSIITGIRARKVTLMRFKGLDLNLLVALDVLVKERSVSRTSSDLRRESAWSWCHRRSGC